LLLISLVVVMLAGTLAGPAAAVSYINNSMKRSASRVKTGQKVTFKTKTVFDWQKVPNPYTSDFYTEVSASGFKKPAITSSQGISKGWKYKNPGKFLAGGTWYVDSGVFWVVSTRTMSMNFTAKAKSGWKKCRARHGQKQGLDVSWGDAAWVTFTHK